MGNALKYSRNNKVTKIDVGFEENAGCILYFIRDNGVGFDMKQASRLFNPFQRLHSQNEFEGTGVGLAIVNRIISKHGGKVWAKSEKGKGATFFFSLPKDNA